MFGYVIPHRPELKVKDYEVFKAYYCGICRAIDKENGVIPRMALNYDIVFLGIMLSSLKDAEMRVGNNPCIAHPLKKRKYVYDDGALEYAANIGTMLAYFNLLDDWEDDRSVKGFLGSALLKRGSGKARKKYQEKYEKIEMYLNELKRLEEERCSIMDQAADVFARLMEEIADYDGIENPAVLKAFRWFGYNLGRWIYILDAFDDIEEDYEDGSYNPIISSMMNKDGFENESADEFRERIKPRIEFTLVSSLASIAETFELLPIERNRDIISNIIYIGMRKKMDSILDRREKNEQSI